MDEESNSVLYVGQKTSLSVLYTGQTKGKYCKKKFCNGKFLLIIPYPAPHGRGDHSNVEFWHTSQL